MDWKRNMHGNDYPSHVRRWLHGGESVCVRPTDRA